MECNLCLKLQPHQKTHDSLTKSDHVFCKSCFSNSMDDVIDDGVEFIEFYNEFFKTYN